MCIGSSMKNINTDVRVFKRFKRIINSSPKSGKTTTTIKVHIRKKNKILRDYNNKIYLTLFTLNNVMEPRRIWVIMTWQWTLDITVWLTQRPINAKRRKVRAFGTETQGFVGQFRPRRPASLWCVRARHYFRPYWMKHFIRSKPKTVEIMWY